MEAKERELLAASTTGLIPRPGVGAVVTAAAGASCRGAPASAPPTPLLVVVVVVLIAVTGILALSETAITRTSKVKARPWSRSSGAGARHPAAPGGAHRRGYCPSCCSPWSCAPWWPPPWSGSVAAHAFGALGRGGGHGVRGGGDLRGGRTGAQDVGRSSTPSGPPSPLLRSSGSSWPSRRWAG